MRNPHAIRGRPGRLLLALLTSAGCAADPTSADSCRRDELGRCTSELSENPDQGEGAKGDGDGDGDLDEGTDEPNNEGLDEGLCAEVELVARPSTPTVIFIIDQSDSMNDDLGGSSRWTVLKETLLGPAGVIAQLEDKVRFGLALYSAESGGSCPQVTSVEVALNNLEAIRGVFGPANTIRETPTGDAIEQVLGTVDFLDAQDPTIFVLATDGEPDRCEELNPQNGQAESIAAIDHAYSQSIRTYVIGVADENELSSQHLQDLANAGAGMTGAPKYRANDPEALRAALDSIVRGEVACVIPLDGKVIGDDLCIGAVQVNGKPVDCDSPDGYRLVNASTIEFVGSACEELKATRVLEAKFPCEAVELF